MFKVYSEDLSGLSYEREFEVEKEAIKYAESLVKEGYQNVYVTKAEEEDASTVEKVIWEESLKEANEEEDIIFDKEEIENIDKPYNDGLFVGDKVKIQGLAEDSPWEGLEGEVTWIDEEDFGDDFQTITVRVNFPTEEGIKEVNQNFDRKNIEKIVSDESEEEIDVEVESLNEEKENLEYLVKDSYEVCCGKSGKEHEYPSVDDVWSDLENNYTNHEVVNDLFKDNTPEGSQAIYKKLESILAGLKVPFYTYDEKDEPICLNCNEELEEEVKTIEIPHEEYIEAEDIKRINDELDKKAKEGKIIGIRREPKMLMLAEPAINGIWTLYLDENGYITKIVLF